MSRKTVVVACAVGLCITLLTLSSNIDHSRADSLATLWTSECILKYGNVRLDSYGEEELFSHAPQRPYQLRQVNGHYYDDYPVGTSILSIPFVAVSHMLGFSMLENSKWMQRIISSIVSIGIFFLMWSMGRHVLSKNGALVLAAIFFFGTSMASTFTSGLWSHNMAVFFVFVSLHELVAAFHEGRPLNNILCVFALFLAYLCRPTMSLAVIFIVLLIATYDFRGSVRVASGVFMLLLLFMAWSHMEFNQSFPDYYMPSKLPAATPRDLATGAWGLLFSPSRGLLVFTPFLLVMGLCYGARRRATFMKRSWLLVGIAWPVSHLLLIAGWPMWWGGHSYGPRLLVDILPGLFVLVLYCMPLELASSLRQRMALGVFLAASAASIWIHSYQGVFNDRTAAWNAEPNIDANKQYLFDWRYPQFLHNERRHRERIELHEEGMP